MFNHSWRYTWVGSYIWNCCQHLSILFSCILRHWTIDYWSPHSATCVDKYHRMKIAKSETFSIVNAWISKACTGAQFAWLCTTLYWSWYLLSSRNTEWYMLRFEKKPLIGYSSMFLCPQGPEMLKTHDWDQTRWALFNRSTYSVPFWSLTYHVLANAKTIMICTHRARIKSATGPHCWASAVWLTVLEGLVGAILSLLWPSSPCSTPVSRLDRNRCAVHDLISCTSIIEHHTRTS